MTDQTMTTTDRVLWCTTCERSDSMPTVPDRCRHCGRQLTPTQLLRPDVPHWWAYAGSALLLGGYALARAVLG